MTEHRCSHRDATHVIAWWDHTCTYPARWSHHYAND